MKSILLSSLLYAGLATAAPYLEERTDVCQYGLYGELVPFLINYEPAVGYCRAVYPQQCGSNPRRRAIGTSTAAPQPLQATTKTPVLAVSTTQNNFVAAVRVPPTSSQTGNAKAPATTKTATGASYDNQNANPRDAAWSKLWKQGNAVVKTLCSCLQGPCKTTSTTVSTLKTTTTSKPGSTTSRSSTTSSQTTPTTSSSSTTIKTTTTSSSSSSSSSSVPTTSSTSTSTTTTTTSTQSTTSTPNATPSLSCGVRGYNSGDANQIGYSTSQADLSQVGCRAYCKASADSTALSYDLPGDSCVCLNLRVSEYFVPEAENFNVFYDIDCPVSSAPTTTSSPLTTMSSTTTSSASSTSTSANSSLQIGCIFEGILIPGSGISGVTTRGSFTVNDCRSLCPFSGPLDAFVTDAYNVGSYNTAIGTYCTCYHDARAQFFSSNGAGTYYYGNDCQLVISIGSTTGDN